MIGEIYGLIRDHLRGQTHPCRVFVAPLDVVIAKDQVVQPDVCIVCDRRKIERTHIDRGRSGRRLRGCLACNLS
ncbi:MAG: hypothetical protein ACP5SH_07490 [Syntrophobacteraceae bacterium]